MEISTWLKKPEHDFVSLRPAAASSPFNLWLTKLELSARRSTDFRRSDAKEENDDSDDDRS